MTANKYLTKLFNRANLIGVLVAVHGIILLAGTLEDQISFRHFFIHVSDIQVDIPLLLGLALLYVSGLLRRRKLNAWIFAVTVYVFLLGLNINLIEHFLMAPGRHLELFLRQLLLPLVILLILIASQKTFVVKSDSRTFTRAVWTAALVLFAAFCYGTGGFLLLDKHDFGREISPLDAMHYTVDQFDLTTTPLIPRTARAHLFEDSLSFISVIAVGFVFVSFFQPLRARFGHQTEQLELARKLIYEHPIDSDDYFKLWPRDKSYIFSSDNAAGVAYKVQGGVAMSVGDPFGDSASVPSALNQFEELCFVNDWAPAFIHTTPASKRRFASRGYQEQQIGEEAVVELAKFNKSVAGSKYFRQIRNRFDKLGFTAEMLVPPHHTAVLARLKTISDEWLTRPGRVERGFVLGYFSEEYLQQCRIFVIRDAAETIQAFCNLVDSPVAEEANYDLLRSADQAPGNSADYLLLELIANLTANGQKRLNLGLSPLAGLDKAPDKLMNKTLHFVYTNGDMLYSFQGLHKFKAKYEPDWNPRFVVYKGGPAGFTKAMRALNKAMKVK